jgi:hypothetical protein
MAAVLQSPVWSKHCEQLKLFTQRCCDCGKVKSSEEFHYFARSPYRCQYRCRSCRAGYDRRRKLFVIVPRTSAIVRLHWKPPAVTIRYTSHLPGEAHGS